jgi:phenylacetate-coenzyme A ligase PaaK-like adenylate-forming protein
MKERLWADLTVETFNFSAAAEVGRIAAECPAHEGLQVVAEQVLLECLAGDTPATQGEPGVVVLT